MVNTESIVKSALKSQKGLAPILIILLVVVGIIAAIIIIPIIKIEIEKRDPSCAWGSDTLLMYGEKPRCQYLKRTDDLFISQELRSHGGSTNTAIADVDAAGWVYFYKGDYDTAMKRFNEEWLLNPSNPLVYFSYAFLSYKENKLSDADRMIDKAFNLDKNVKFQEQFCLSTFLTGMANDKAKVSTGDEFYTRLQNNFNKSSQKFDLNSCHTDYSIEYFEMGDSAKAQQELDLAKQNGASPQTVQFLNAILSGKAFAEMMNAQKGN